MSSDNTSLPPGWEARYDFNLGKTYYINHIDKSTSWEPPSKNRKSTNAASFSKQSNGNSKRSTNSGVEYIPLQELSSKTRGSPLSVRSKVQDTTLSNATDSDQAISKLSAMFPTVSDTHIRLLMKNYRYMKSIFPEAEETIILDILSNNENNIQKSSDKLKEMGFKKKDSVKLQQEVKVKAAEPKVSQPELPVVPKVKTVEEKTKVKIELQKEYHGVPEQLITMALESVDFDKEKAINLLKDATEYIVTVDGGKIVETTEVENLTEPDNQQIKISISQSRQSLKSLLKSEKTDKENSITFNRVIEESNPGYKSDYLSNTKGANPIFAKGNNDKLLLEDYIKWQGPNASLHLGPRKGLANGPQSSYIFERKRLACGPNPEFHKGPNKNLARGSIFQQMKAAVMVGGECRGK